VTKVVSGSFLEIEIQDHAYQVQLIGLKAPMPGAHSHPPECYGDESQRYLQGLIGSSGRVQLATDGQLPDQDEFGILQRYVMGQDGSLLNRQMIDAGMVEESGGAGYDQKVAFMGAQEAAKAAERGLWGACRQDVPTPTPTTSPQATPTSTPVGAVSTEPNVVRPIAPTSIPTPQPTQKPAKIGNTDELPEVQLQQSSRSGQPI
jgi:endonuclease YncB( thermonuclease family)